MPHKAVKMAKPENTAASVPANNLGNAGLSAGAKEESVIR